MHVNKNKDYKATLFKIALMSKEHSRTQELTCTIEEAMQSS